MFFFKKHKISEELDMSNIPQHIGIIMDGNGRWAKKRGLPRSAGHRAGAETLKKIVVYCNKIGVKSITAYAFSTENWNRPQAEVDALMELLYMYLGQVEEQFAGTNVILRVIGDRSALPEKINKAIDYAESYTSKNTGLVLNVALNYGGRDEICRAARLAAKAVETGEIKAEDITEEYMSSLMYTKDVPELDLIIRPSGEVRLSNFLLWQAAYAEFWFDSINWPDFSEKDMERAVLDYQKRNRRFGKV
ncbi:MAG: isoprenyl transferase [Ruminococcaceae bacterium]|nr:isoprenyl transferase [Oscillospiraceae bacterium]